MDVIITRYYKKNRVTLSLISIRADSAFSHTQAHTHKFSVLRHASVVLIIRRRPLNRDVSLVIQLGILRTRLDSMLIIQPLDLLARDTQLIVRQPDDRLTFPECRVIERVGVHACRVAVLFAGGRGVVVSDEGITARLAVAAFSAGGGCLVELGRRCAAADQG